MSECPPNKLPEENLTPAASAGQSEVRLQSPTGSQEGCVAYSSDTQSVRRAGICSTTAPTFPRPQEAEPPTSTTAGTPEGDERLSADIGKAVGSRGSVAPFTTSSSTSRPDPVTSTQAGLQSQQSVLPVNYPSDRTRFKIFPLRWFFKPRIAVGKRPVDLEARDLSVIRNVPLKIIACLVSVPSSDTG